MQRSVELKQTATLPVRPDGSLRLAVVADTHSSPHPQLPKHLRALQPDAILHAGDIGNLSVLEHLKGVAPLYTVRGNIDGRAPTLPDVLVLNITAAERLRLRILLLHIGVNGPRIRADVARLARSEAASLIICGHSHVPFIGRERELSVFNPGSVGPRRFSLPIVFGRLDLTGDKVRLAHIDCETGQPWTPP
ncbi:MAG TPA: metallophosphoesterase family protein [Polyangiaceae bacterium]|nr:metallophosphoesterase family protein [Polyangiaceae bacterium]